MPDKVSNGTKVASFATIINFIPICGGFGECKMAFNYKKMAQGPIVVLSTKAPKLYIFCVFHHFVTQKIVEIG